MYASIFLMLAQVLSQTLKFTSKCLQLCHTVSLEACALKVGRPSLQVWLTSFFMTPEWKMIFYISSGYILLFYNYYILNGYINPHTIACIFCQQTRKHVLFDSARIISTGLKSKEKIIQIQISLGNSRLNLKRFVSDDPAKALMRY